MAVEFYNAKNDKKSNYFEKKIQDLLVKPEIMITMAAPRKTVDY